MVKDIPIVIACDDKYVKFAAVTISSIMANSSKKNKYIINILTEYISEKNILLLKEQINKKKNFSLNIIDVSKFDLSDFYLNPESHIISLTTYYRFFIAELLPQYDKVIYLDSDLVVNIDLANMLNEDLGNNILGAVEDFCDKNDKLYLNLYNNKVEYIWGIKNYTLEYYRDVLNLKKDWKYFNAGIILFNTKLMREIKFSQELVNKLTEVKTPPLQDQDILNSCVFNNKFYGGGI